MGYIFLFAATNAAGLSMTCEKTADGRARHVNGERHRSVSTFNSMFKGQYSEFMVKYHDRAGVVSYTSYRSRLGYRRRANKSLTHPSRSLPVLGLL